MESMCAVQMDTNIGLVFAEDTYNPLELFLVDLSFFLSRGLSTCTFSKISDFS